jgi:hypothetical protein
MDEWKSALLWTWAALITFVVAGNVLLWLGPGTPLGGILSVAGLGLALVASIKTVRAWRR